MTSGNSTGRKAVRPLDAEAVKLIGRLNDEQRRVILYLGRLYLERKMAPSSTVNAEIERIQRAIRNGSIPYDLQVPSLH